MWRNSQKSVGRSGSLANGAPSLSLVTFVFVKVRTGVGVPLLKMGSKYDLVPLSFAE